MLIHHVNSELETVHRDVLMSLITTERIAALPGDNGYSITDVGLFDAGRPDLLQGHLVAVCAPATHRVAVCSDVNRLLAVDIGLPGLWQTWRDMVPFALQRVDWYLTGGWTPVLEQPVDSTEPLTFIAPAGHVPPEMLAWHLGRGLTDHRIEDNCPCRKAKCGLVDERASECVEHTPGRAMGQRHRGYDCPAR